MITNSTHLTALLLSLLIYGVLAMAYFGWGRLISHLWVVSRQEKQMATYHIWIGWAVTLWIFQLVHFFLPLTVFVVAPMLSVGITYSLWEIFRTRSDTINAPSTSMNLWRCGLLVILLVLSGWIASRAMLHPMNWDSGLYHFNIIRWYNTYPIVPGLGNLHIRLAFNQSFFVYAATLNFFPIFGHGHSIANSFLFLLTVATFLEFLYPVIRSPRLLIESHPFLYLPSLFMLPVLSYLALSSKDLMSPSPDLASTLLQMVLFAIFAQNIVTWRNGQRGKNNESVSLVILATTAITIKLSLLSFAAVILAFVLGYAWKSPVKPLFRCNVLVVFFILLVWCGRGMVLSGAPLLPSTIGYMNLEWSVPKENITRLAYWVRSWARQPKVHWEEVLGNWRWFGPWLKKISSEHIAVVYPLTLAVLFSVVAAGIRIYKKTNRPNILDWAIFAPIITGLIYWFFTAPDIRFAHALFFILMYCGALLFITSIQDVLTKRIFLIVICLIFLTINYRLVMYVKVNWHNVKKVSVSGYHPLKKVPLVQRVTKSGLRVYVPKAGKQCWDSPLPSVPSASYFNERLRLRHPNKQSSGFTVKGAD